MTVPHVSVLINGTPGSAASERATGLFGHSQLILDGHARVDIHFRSEGKVRATAAFFAGLIRSRPDIVYVIDLSASGVTAAVAYRMLALGSRLVIDTGDAITALARKLGTRGRVGIMATAALEQTGHWAADCLVVRGTEHVRHLRHYANKATVIQDGVDLFDYSAVQPIATAPQFTAADPLVVGVLGSLDWNPLLKWCYGAELIEALHLIPSQLPIRGVIIGDGSGLTHLRELVSRWNLDDRVTFVGRVPPNRLPDSLGTMHIALSTQTNDVVGQVRTTGKLPLYLASRRYLLASRVGEAARLLPESMLVDYHGQFDSGYPARLADALRHLVVDRQKVAALSAVGPALAKTLDYRVLAARLDAEVLAPLLGK